MLITLLVALGAASTAVLWLGPPKSGRGTLVDSHGRRHELVSKHPQPAFARDILDRFRRWRDPDASGASPRDRLRGAYTLLLGTAGAGFLVLFTLRRNRP